MCAHAQTILAMPRDVCRGAAALLCDLDDTLTEHGRLTERAFSALWRAHRSGLPVVVVTGRPAGWADHLARMWPVHGVVGENGGLYFRHRDGAMHRYFAYDAPTRAEFRARLDAIRDQILRDVPGCAVSADQPYREFDLAIDFCEDVTPLDQAAVRRIREIFTAHGATAKISSIHVNGWFGEFDKRRTASRYLAVEMGLDPDADRGRVIFAGDSPNDEPMFAFFPHSVGVANIHDMAQLLDVWPAYITERRGGDGFAEAVDHILDMREAP